ncbi:hypothetical protein ACKVMT_05725 [Halobacteriales archaeon Cl-PHB]
MTPEHSPNLHPDDRPTTDRSTADELDEAVATFLETHGETIRAGPHLSTDVLFDLLAHPGRRYVLSYLLQREGSVTCGDLVDYVVSQTDPSMTPAAFRDGLASELTHTHLPRLDSEGLVEYDVERQVVTPTDLTPVVAPYLEFAMAQERVRRRALSE